MDSKQTGLSADGIDQILASPFSQLLEHPEILRSITTRCKEKPPVEAIVSRLLTEINALVDYVEGCLEYDTSKDLYLSLGPSMGYFDRVTEIGITATTLAILYATSIPDRVRIPTLDGSEQYWLPPGPHRDLTDLIFNVFLATASDRHGDRMAIPGSKMRYLKQIGTPLRRTLQQLKPGAEVTGDSEEWISQAEVLKRFQVDKSTVYRNRCADKIPSRKIRRGSRDTYEYPLRAVAKLWPQRIEK